MNNIESSSLYEQDYYLWLEDTYQKLEKKDINGIDLIHFFLLQYFLNIVLLKLISCWILNFLP